MIRMIMLDKDVRKKDLADALEIAPQSFYNKLSRDKMDFDTVADILDKLGCDVIARDRVSGKVYET